MDYNGFEGAPLGWWSRVRAAWPAIVEYLLQQGRLRSILLLVIALSTSASAEEVMTFLPGAGAALLGLVSIFIPRASERAGWFFRNLSEPGTLRSLGVLVLGLGMGASATSMVDGIEALAVLLLGGVSAAAPAQGAR